MCPEPSLPGGAELVAGVDSCSGGLSRRRKVYSSQSRAPGASRQAPAAGTGFARVTLGLPPLQTEQRP